MAYVEILSPLKEPTAYLAWIANLLAIIVIAAACLVFFRRNRQMWWLLLGTAFVLDPVLEFIHALWHGDPLLPFALVQPMRQVTDGTFESSTDVTIHWNAVSYLVAIALAWGAWCEKRPSRGG